jgi:hypothetical protein
LKDIRDETQKKAEEETGHFVIEGNILDVKSNIVFDNIREKIETDKTDLIISRLGRPLEFIDKNTAILDRIIRNWYEMLNQNGLLFVEFQFRSVPDLKNQVESWINIVRAKFPEIDITVGVSGTLRLHKGKGAPDKLPPATQLFD